jgi:penicillin-binding protein 1A
MSAPVLVRNPRFGGAWMQALRAFVFACLVLGAAAAAIGVGVYAHYAKGLPEVPPFEAHTFEGVNTLLAADGQSIGEVYHERRVMLPYERIPRTLILAFLATEDTRFFTHSGLDLRAIARAAVRNLRAGAVLEGGSTITQQLAKSWLGNRKSLQRKLREAVLARRIEDVYTKEQILLLYLNAIFLGNHSYGVQAAAQNYFRKNVWNLTLGEIALLAGLPQAPSRYNPAYNLPRALERRKWVLERMLDAGFITADQAEAAGMEKVDIAPMLDDFGDKVPHFAQRVLFELDQKLGAGWRRDSLTIETTADVEAGVEAERALQDGLHALDRRQGWRGPLARVGSEEEQGELLERARAYRGGAAPVEGDLLVGVVTDVRADGARVALDNETPGFIPLSELAWAAKYTELPKDPRSGERDESKSASLDGRVDNPRSVLSRGDVVLVQVMPMTAAERKRAKLPRPLSDGILLRLEQVPVVEGALLCHERRSGAVAALVGSYDYDRSQFDRTHAPRQTGSTMKPLVYGKAYDLGMPPSRVISGAPFELNGYNPTGDESVHDSTAWDALARSENSISLRVHQFVLERAGKEGLASFGAALGLSRPFQGYPSEVLGMDQTMWDMAGAYSALAELGSRPARRLVRMATARDGRVVWRDLEVTDRGLTLRQTLDAMYDALAPMSAPVIPPETAYLVSANMAQTTLRGTAASASKRLDFPTAGKTGTLPYDVWFIGYSGRLVTATWVGSDLRERFLGHSKRKGKVTGANTALPIWLKFMEAAHKGKPPLDLLPPPPAEVEWLDIDPKSGLKARSGGMAMAHRKGTGPTELAPDGDAPQALPGAEELEF